LFASGPFIADPSTMADQHSIQGAVHGLLGAVVFSLAPVSCFVLYRRFRGDPVWHGLSHWTLATGMALVLEVGLLKGAQQPDSAMFAWKGLIQRGFLLSFMGWLFAVAAHLRYTAVHDGARHNRPAVGRN